MLKYCGHTKQQQFQDTPWPALCMLSLLQATTLPGYASRAPMLKGGASVKGSSSGVAEATFDLTFQMNSAGAVKFLVMHSKVYARFMDTYVVFDNEVRRAGGKSAHTDRCNSRVDFTCGVCLYKTSADSQRIVHGPHNPNGGFGGKAALTPAC